MRSICQQPDRLFTPTPYPSTLQPATQPLGSALHGVPEPVLTVRLDGSVEYETSDGEVRHVSAGSFVLVADTHGKGHLSRHSPEAQTVIWISPAERP